MLKNVGIILVFGKEGTVKYQTIYFDLILKLPKIYSSIYNPNVSLKYASLLLCLFQ